LFEQLVRPFQTRQIGTTRRIVPVRTNVPETPEEARITWGSTGNLAQGVVQAKGVNLENIETVGWNLRGNIDNFNQSSRRDEQVELAINDESGNRVGTAVIDRAKEVGFQKPFDPKSFSNFGYNPNYRPNRKPFSYEAEGKPKRYDIGPSTGGVTSKTPAETGALGEVTGLRADVPGKDVSGRNDVYIYPSTTIP
jgi:hypothetical protein